MSFLLTDDKFPKHRKVRGLPVQAKWLHFCALSHCAEELTDGHLTEYDLGIIAASSEVKPLKYVPLLVERVLWIPTVEGWTIHDYLEHNPSGNEVRAKRSARAEAGRRGGIASGKSRSKGEAVAEAIASSLALASVEPHPIPSHPTEDLSIPTVVSYAGKDFNKSEHGVWETILSSCSPGDREKLNEAYDERRPSHHRLEQILFAIRRPDTRDRTGKALSMIRKEAA